MIKLEDLRWVKLKKPEDFLKVKETLTRIGIASKKEKKLYQSCHILHKKGRYAIVSFKEMFMLDGKPTDFTLEDRERRDAIVQLLVQWGLVTMESPTIFQPSLLNDKSLKIIHFSEKDEWELIPKYNIGKKFS